MKLLAVVALTAAAAAAAAVLAVQYDSDRISYEGEFALDATYHLERGDLQIVFEDKTGGASEITMQILGLREPFLRHYEGYGFEESVEFESEPRYGWKAHPIIVRFEHSEYGPVGIKTEAHERGEKPPNLIYESP